MTKYMLVLPIVLVCEAVRGEAVSVLALLTYHVLCPLLHLSEGQERVEFVFGKMRERQASIQRRRQERDRDR